MVISCEQQDKNVGAIDLVAVPDKELYWVLDGKDATRECEVTFKVPPRHNFDIMLRQLDLDGDFSEGIPYSFFKDNF